MRRDVLVCLFLTAATLAVYWQVKNFEFVDFDDTAYITENPNVQTGLTLKSITWSFTATYRGNWQPLTWLSYMLGCQLYGLNPGWHHLTNVFFHIANTLLLFIILRRMTGDLWQSGFVAALFALHPLHVESVAWVAERKDVLSTFFWMLTMWSYVRYVERPGVKRYLSVLLLFILGLMSKPMLVTLPFVLLLLDFWPLGRIQFGDTGGKSSSRQSSAALRLVLEKTPLFFLATAASVVTFLAQQRWGAVSSLDIHPLGVRVANAIVSYVSYIGKMLWPSDLAVLYPHPGMLPWWKVAGASLLLAAITLFAIRSVRQRPYIAAGWLWYIGTLVPVIGLVQVGMQAMADRYTYVPLVGIFIVISWSAPDLAAGWRYRDRGLAAIASALLLMLMAATWVQVGYWANSVTLFEHALDVTVNNYVAHMKMGGYLAGQGRTSEAIEHYTEVLRIKPNHAKAHNNLGVVLAKLGRTSEAVSHYTEALQIKPDFAEAHGNLGIALSSQRKLNEAIHHFSEALRIKPDFTKAHLNLGLALTEQGRTDEAVNHYTEALRIRPNYAEAHNNLGAALVGQGRSDEAIKHYTEALKIKPDYAEVHNNLGAALVKQGRTSEAIKHYYEALRINPGCAEAHYNVGLVLAGQGRTSEAVRHYTDALLIKPDFVEAHSSLGAALAGQGRTSEAISHYTDALLIKPDFVEVHNNLGLALIRKGKIEEAIFHFREALRIRPDYAKAQSNLKKALAVKRKFEEAVTKTKKH